MSAKSAIAGIYLGKGGCGCGLCGDKACKSECKSDRGAWYGQDASNGGGVVIGRFVQVVQLGSGSPDRWLRLDQAKTASAAPAAGATSALDDFQVGRDWRQQSRRSVP